MNEISWNKSKLITKLIALFTLILLFSICVGISSADIEIQDIEEGDSIWVIIDVDSQGQVGVTARTNGSNNDEIKLYLYNQTHLVASASGYYDQVSIGDLPLPAGRYIVNAYLTDAYRGGTRIISITSNRPLSLLPKYRKSVFGLVDGEAYSSTLNVDKGGWVFVNAWTNGSNNDDIQLYLYNQTHLVASASGSYDQVSITYLAPSAGIYKVKAYLTDAYGGGTRTISVTSNYPVEETISGNTTYPIWKIPGKLWKIPGELLTSIFHPDYTKPYESPKVIIINQKIENKSNLQTIGTLCSIIFILVMLIYGPGGLERRKEIKKQIDLIKNKMK